MASYAHARNAQGVRLNLSFLGSGLRFPWISITFLVGFVIEAMLAARLWLQLNNADVSGMRQVLLSITDVLVSPFGNGQSTALQERANGIFEYSTLVAVEAYLLVMLAIVGLVVALRFAVFGVHSGMALKRWQAQRSARRRSQVADRQLSTTVEPVDPVGFDPEPPSLPRRLAGTRITTQEHEVTHP